MADEHGLDVSVSGLSNWSRGRPPRDVTDPRIPALEQILDLPRGSLLLLLAPKTKGPSTSAVAAVRPRSEEEAMRELRAYTARLSSTDRYVTTALQEKLYVGADRKPYQRDVHQTVVAVQDDADCAWLYYSPDGDGITTEVHPARPLHKGRHITRPQQKLEALELLFGRELLRGETLTFAYRVLEQHVSQPMPIYRRATSAPSGAGQPPFDRLSMSVEFVVPPRAGLVWDGRGEASKTAEEIPLDGDVAGRAVRNPAPRMYGLRWQW
jgi:hypothetical protein